MDDLVSAVNKIADLLESSTPTWISAVSIIVPIVLTIVSITLSVRMDKNNEKLQKMLANRDMLNQTRQCVLGIYDAFFNGFHILMQANGNIADIFVSDQSYYRWAQDIENATKEITHAYNRTKLLLDDAKLLKQLCDAQTAFFCSGACCEILYLHRNSSTDNCQCMDTVFQPVFHSARKLLCSVSESLFRRNFF